MPEFAVELIDLAPAILDRLIDRVTEMRDEGAVEAGLELAQLLMLLYQHVVPEQVVDAVDVSMDSADGTKQRAIVVAGIAAIGDGIGRATVLIVLLQQQ